MQEQPQKQDINKKVKEGAQNKKSEWKNFAKTIALQALSITSQALLAGFATAAGGFIFRKITERGTDTDNVIPLRKHG